MKPWMNWSAAGAVLMLLVMTRLRTLFACKAPQAALEAQQKAQKTQVSIDLVNEHLVQVKTIEWRLTAPIAGPTTQIPALASHNSHR